MTFERAFSGAPWEKVVGYCRAIRAGDHIYVTGTTAIDDAGKPFAPGDGYAQALRCIELIERALGKLGADLSSVVRTRIFVTDISRWEEFLSTLAKLASTAITREPAFGGPRENGRAHRERFGEHPPATTMVEVKALISPELLIEIEADAVVLEGSQRRMD